LLAGTEGGSNPAVSSDGRKLAFLASDGAFRTVAIVGTTGTRTAKAWRYGSIAWIGDSAIVATALGVLVKMTLDGGSPAAITHIDTARGDGAHAGPLLLPGGRGVIFTVTKRRGPGLVTGQLAFASLDAAGGAAAPHVMLDVMARTAVAFVQGWLLFINVEGTAIEAVRLDTDNRRTVGAPITVHQDAGGNLETGSLADNGTLVYVRRQRTNSVVWVDTTGAVRPLVRAADGVEFMHPRISPDGRRFVVGAGSKDGSDAWVYDMASRTPPFRVTTTGRARQPTWTADGQRILFFVTPTRELFVQPVTGGRAVALADTKDAFAPAASPDGRSVLFQRGPTSGSAWTIWSASVSTVEPAHMIATDLAGAYMPTLSMDGQWLAYVSRTTGREEVYVRSFPEAGPTLEISGNGGTEPAWSPDGNRIYYRSRSAFMEATATGTPLRVTSRRQLFEDSFDHSMPHRNYDVAPDGTGFLMIGQQSPEAVVVLNWLPRLREKLRRAR
jgi:serine/threonine-protein kinase